MAVEIWRLPRVLKATGMGRSWVYDRIAKGEFPAPLKLSERAVGWKREDIETWLESRETRAA